MPWRLWAETEPPAPLHQGEWLDSRHRARGSRDDLRGRDSTCPSLKAREENSPGHLLGPGYSGRDSG